jgi:hypothetical protein
LAEVGKLIADWFAADSNGSAHILYLANNSASIVKYDRAAKEEFADVCPSCSVTYIDYNSLALDIRQSRSHSNHSSGEGRRARTSLARGTVKIALLGDDQPYPGP